MLFTQVFFAFTLYIKNYVVVFHLVIHHQFTQHWKCNKQGCRVFEECLENVVSSTYLIYALKIHAWILHLLLQQSIQEGKLKRSYSFLEVCSLNVISFSAKAVMFMLMNAMLRRMEVKVRGSSLETCLKQFVGKEFLSREEDVWTGMHESES